MREAISWTTRGGKAIEIAVELKTSETIYADGHMVEVAACELVISASADGAPHMGYLSRNVPQAALDLSPDAAAVFGRIVIPAARLAEIDEAIARFHATPDWQAKEQAMAAARQAAAEYEAHRGRMRAAMGY